MECSFCAQKPDTNRVINIFHGAVLRASVRGQKEGKNRFVAALTGRRQHQQEENDERFLRATTEKRENCSSSWVTFFSISRAKAIPISSRVSNNRGKREQGKTLCIESEGVFAIIQRRSQNKSLCVEGEISVLRVGEDETKRLQKWKSIKRRGSNPKWSSHLKRFEHGVCGSWKLPDRPVEEEADWQRRERRRNLRLNPPMGSSSSRIV